ncbi:hypothetical protein [Streptomyces sp. NPDC051921]
MTTNEEIMNVALKPPYGDTPLAFDPNPRNDQAKIVLNPAG